MSDFYFLFIKINTNYKNRWNGKMCMYAFELGLIKAQCGINFYARSTNKTRNLENHHPQHLYTTILHTCDTTSCLHYLYYLRNYLIIFLQLGKVKEEGNTALSQALGPAEDPPSSTS